MKKSIIIGVCILLLVFGLAAAQPGNSCISSPCSCGVNCQGGGYETGNNFNTIDGHLVSGCWDGADYSFEYTHDINVTDLDLDIFAVGDRIRIDAYVQCDGSEDYVLFLYRNGTKWSTLNYTVCTVAGINKFSINHTLHNVVANHTIRVSTFWKENTNDACVSTATCGYACEPVYSDTDDVNIYVQAKEYSVPQVYLNYPIAEYHDYDVDYLINISANVSDPSGIDSVFANISWALGSQLVSLASSGAKYIGNFSGVNYLGRYNVTILATDIFNNLNDTQKGYFILNSTVNITIASPIDEFSYVTNNVSLLFEVRDEFTIDTVRYLFNGDTYIGKNKGILNNNSILGYYNTSMYQNLTQSFIASEEYNVRRIDFYFSGVTSNVSFELRQNRTANTLATGSVRCQSIVLGLCTGFLNDTILVLPNISYFVVLTDGFSSWAYSENHTGTGFINDTIISGDFLLYIKDEYDFESTLFMEPGQNNLTIIKNNTYGLEQEKSIQFYYDTIDPQITGYDFESVMEIGTRYPIYLYAYDAYSPLNKGLAEIDGINYSMQKINSTAFMLNFTPAYLGDYNLMFHVNDSSGNRNSSGMLSFYVNDTSAPIISNISYLPQTEEQLDPNVTIVVNVDIFDFLNISSSYLEYKLSGSSWSRTSLTDAANFTPTSTGIWIFRIFSNDTVGNYNYSTNHSLNVSFDDTWELKPKTFGTNSSAVGTTKIIGLLAINNTGDYEKQFNITYSGTPVVTFNTSSITASAHEIHKVKVNITAPLTVSDYFIRFTVTDGTVTRYSNISFISYLSGPYLYLQMPVYTSQSTPGSHINLISLKITNMGNDTSTNTTLRWILPSIMTSRNQLNRTLGNISIGQDMFVNISADISSSATAGVYTFTALLNNSEGNSNSISKTITITRSEGGSGSGGSSSSSSSASTGGYVRYVREDDMFLMNDTFNVPRGISYPINILILNNISKKDYYGMDVFIEGIFSKFYKAGSIDILSGEQKTVSINLSLPDYYPEGKKEYTLSFMMKNASITKQIFLNVYDPKVSAKECIKESEGLIGKLGEITKKDFSVDLVKSQQYLKEYDYLKVKEFCDKVSRFYSDAVYVQDAISKLENKIKEYESLGYDTTDMVSYLNLVKEELEKGNMDLSKEYLIKANQFIESAGIVNKPFLNLLKEFFQKNAYFFISMLIMVPLVSFLLMKIVSAAKVENKIISLEKEKKKLLALIKEAQENYYLNHLITEDIYSSFVKEYRERIGQIEVSLIKLDNKLPKQQELIREKIIEAQDEYYVKGILDHESFEKMEEIYEASLNELSQIEDLPEEKHFHLNDGRRLASLDELKRADLPEKVYSYHVNEHKNDFASWIEGTLGKKELAHKLRKAKDKTEFERVINER